jgi:hypothetical protein
VAVSSLVSLANHQAFSKIDTESKRHGGTEGIPFFLTTKVTRSLRDAKSKVGSGSKQFSVSSKPPDVFENRHRVKKARGTGGIPY